MALITKPPVRTTSIGTRVSAGLYRDAKGNIVKSTTGRIPVAKPKVVTPAVTTTTPAVATAAAVPLAQPAPQVPTVMSPDTTNTLFPNTRMFEPENYGGSPLYQFQLKEGQKALGNSLAAKGLTNSGHAITEELSLPLRVAAQDTDRMTRIASENADRLFNIQRDESLRQERGSNEQFNRRLSLAELMSQQDPFSQAVAGFNSSAGISKEQGESLANYLKDAYKRVVASGGTGGSGGSGGRATQPIPAFPGQPNYLNIMPQEILAGANKDAGTSNIITNLITGLLK